MKGKKVIIVEDIIDTGGTIIAMTNLLRAHGVEVISIIAVAEKVDYKGLERIEQQTGIKPNVLVSFLSNETKSNVISRHNS